LSSPFLSPYSKQLSLDKHTSYEILYNNKMGRGGKMKISTRGWAGLVLGSSFVPWGIEWAETQPFGISQQGAAAQPVVQCLSSARGRFVFGQISDSSTKL
jgi:hypothetical protein